MQLVDLSCASSDMMTIQHLTMCADLRWLAIRQQTMMAVLICISLLCLCVLLFLCQCEVIKTDS